MEPTWRAKKSPRSSTSMRPWPTATRRPHPAAHVKITSPARVLSAVIACSSMTPPLLGSQRCPIQRADAKSAGRHDATPSGRRRGTHAMWLPARHAGQTSIVARGRPPALRALVDVLEPEGLVERRRRLRRLAAQRALDGAGAQLELPGDLVQSALPRVAAHEQPVGVLAARVLVEDVLRSRDALAEAVVGQVRGREPVEQV